MTGLAVDVRVRMLVLHEAEGFRERSVSMSVGYDPTPQTPLGPTARLAPSWGGPATGGAEALWSGGPLGRLGAYGTAGAAGRVDAELGYGLSVGSKLVGTPRMGFGTSAHGRDYRLGYGLGLIEADDVRFAVGVDAQRREGAMAEGADNAVLGRATVQW